MSRARDSIIATLAVAIDRRLERPVSRQLADLLWTEIIDGNLEPGERLPTERQLAVGLGVHPRIVSRALADLERRGVVRAEPGGVFVCLTEAEPAALEKARALELVCNRAIAEAEALGLSVDDLIEELAELRLARDSRERS